MYNKISLGNNRQFKLGSLAMFNIQKDFYFLMKYNSREPVERRFPIKKRGDEFKKNMSLHTEGFFFFF